MEEAPRPSYRLGERSSEFEAHPERVAPGDLNNLHLWLPSSGHRDFYEEGKALDTPLPEGVRRGNTLREFFDIVELTLHELPVDQRDLIVQRNTERNAARSQGIVARMQATQKLNDVLVPLYLALRAKGYSQKDLVT